MVCEQDLSRLKIVDFGFAAFDEAAASGLNTPTGGTPGYKVLQPL
jgi:hypothetical protein